MKFIKQYIEEKYFLQTNGRVTLQHICDDAGLDGVKVFINNVETGLFISQAEYDEWMESMFDEIKSKNEDKLTYKVAPRFKVGDWAVYNNTNVYQVKKIEYIINMIPRYELENIDGDKFSIPFTSDYNLRKWTFNDAKDGDVLVCDDKNLKTPFVAIYNGLKDNFTFSSHCFIGFNGIFYEGEEGHDIEDIKPATKEQRDILFAKMKEAGYEWDSDNKELKKIEQKPLERSEDERIRKELLEYLQRCVKCNPLTEETEKIMKDSIAWLEKLGEEESTTNVPSREVILSIWDLGNLWKVLTNGNFSTEYGTQIEYIQKHWHDKIMKTKNSK